MQHGSLAIWNAFVQGTLSEQQVTELEDHLYTCDACLQLYMQAVEQVELSLELTNLDALTDSVMEQLPKDRQVGTLEKTGINPHSSRSKRRFVQHPLFHYGIAASITIVMMSTGFFQSLTGVVSTVEAESLPDDAPSSSISQTIVNTLFGSIDQMLAPSGEERMKGHE